MALDRYFIVEHDKDGAPDGALEGFGAAPMGAPAAAAPAAVKVSAVELNPNEAASERKRDGVQVVGLAMPLALIEPLENQPVAAADASPVAWGISATGADQSPLDGNGVTVAVLDTGIKADQPAFAGMTLDKADFTDTGGSAEDRHGHGTHCAGTIFGRDVGGTRIGIARGIQRALIGKVIPDNKAGDSTMLFDALNWASREGADIVSMSLGFDFPGLVAKFVAGGMPERLAVSNALVTFSQNLRGFDALMATFRAGEPFGRNMLVIAAAGNESQRAAAQSFRISASLPSAAAGVVSVAAYGRKGAGYDIAPFSNANAQIAGPGVAIPSAGLDGGLAEMSGTSQACPHIAGLAALWWQKIRADGETPTPDKVREKMFAGATTTKLPAACGEVDRGRGRALAPS